MLVLLIIISIKGIWKFSNLLHLFLCCLGLKKSSLRLVGLLTEEMKSDWFITNMTIYIHHMYLTLSVYNISRLHSRHVVVYYYITRDPNVPFKFSGFTQKVIGTGSCFCTIVMQILETISE